MRCNHSEECKQATCPHYSEHDEQFNAEGESLCKQPVYYGIQEMVACI